jgi:hypothetical protein
LDAAVARDRVEEGDDRLVRCFIHALVVKQVREVAAQKVDALLWLVVCS